MPKDWQARVLSDLKPLTPDSNLAAVVLANLSLRSGLNLNDDQVDRLLGESWLKEGLIEAWREGNFHKIYIKIRKFLGLSMPPPYRAPFDDDSYRATEGAWRIPYLGTAQHRLLAAAAEHKEMKGDRNYTNHMTIIQSSGTGKSRMVDEVAKLVFTLPFNLRERTNGGAYPLPDTAVAEHFLNLAQNTRYRVACYFLHFFTCLFKVAEKELKELPDLANYPTSLPSMWRDHLNEQATPLQLGYEQKGVGKTRRNVLYQKAIDLSRATKLALPPATQDEEGELVEAYQRGEEWDQGLLLAGRLAAEKAGNSLIEGILKRCAQSEGASDLIVLYFDESHTLFERKTTDISEDGTAQTYYDSLLCALNNLETCNVVSFFLSTNSGLARYAPPWRKMASDRAQHLQLLAPFAELSFDCHPSFPLQEGTMTLEEASTDEYLCRFGRPLFWSRYEKGIHITRKHIVNFAASKLICAHRLEDLKKPAVNPSREELTNETMAHLALLDSRILLDFEPRRQLANTAQQRLIESHMRIAFSVPVHREYSVSGYPSEPILAEAAARTLAALRDKEGDEHIACILNDFTDSGLITKGERGEMVARLLLILAMDKAQERYAKDNRRSTHYSRPVPLSIFLQELLGHEHWDEIKVWRPDNVAKEASQPFEEAFRHAKVRFTHFGRAGDDLGSSSAAAFAALLRAMAIQCHVAQGSIDLVIPIFLDNAEGTEKLAESKVTGCLISIKNRSEKSTSADVAVDEAKLRFFPSDSSDTEEAARPYVVIVMELGVQAPLKNEQKIRVKEPKLDIQVGKKRKGADQVPSVPAKKAKSVKASPTAGHLHFGLPLPRRSRRHAGAHPRYRMTILGCSSTVYSVISSENAYAKLLSSRQLFAEHPRQDKMFLDAVKGLKPLWIAGEPCYNWVGVQRLHRPLGVPEGNARADPSSSMTGSIIQPAEPSVEPATDVPGGGSGSHTPGSSHVLRDDDNEETWYSGPSDLTDVHDYQDYMEDSSEEVDVEDGAGAHINCEHDSEGMDDSEMNLARPEAM